MSIAIERDADRHLVRATARGPLQVDELLTFISETWTVTPEGHAILFDARTSDVQFTAGGVRQLADLTRQHTLRLNAPVAIVTGADHHFGLARMYQTLCDISRGAMVYVCRTIPDAEAWLARRLQERLANNP